MDGLLACLTRNSCKLGVHPARFCVCVCVSVSKERRRGLRQDFTDVNVAGS